MIVTVLIEADVANAVVIFVGMRSYVYAGNVMAAVCSVIVIIFVVCPRCVVIGVGVIVIPKTTVADTVVVFVLVCGLVSNLDVMTAVYVVPVIIVVV